MSCPTCFYHVQSLDQQSRDVTLRFMDLCDPSIPHSILRYKITVNNAISNIRLYELHVGGPDCSHLHRKGPFPTYDHSRYVITLVKAIQRFWPDFSVDSL